MTGGKMSSGQSRIVTEDSELEYEWGISHEPTREELDDHLNSLSMRRGLADSTLKTKRSRLAKYARLYEELHGTGNLLDPTDSGEARNPEAFAYGRAVEVFDVIDNEISSDSSKLMYYSDINQFYNRLRRWGKVDVNPVEKVPDEFAWEREERDNPPLAASDVQKLYSSAATTWSELLVFGLCAWGLRPNEVASLHRSQIQNLDGDESVNDGYPFIEFEERKNGPGTVTMLFGVETVRDWFSSRDGYMYPSDQSASGHVTTKTIENRFHDLAQEAGVTIRGETPTPKTGRRFWYTTYQTVMGEIYSQLDIVAEEQGSDSAGVVEENYISKDARRKMRRSMMRDALADAFEGES